jgi:hypothetical protein
MCNHKSKFLYISIFTSLSGLFLTASNFLIPTIDNQIQYKILSPIGIGLLLLATFFFIQHFKYIKKQKLLLHKQSNYDYNETV